MPIIATDGSSLGTRTEDGWKPEGHGGWAAVVRFEDDHPRAPGFVQEIVGGKRRTTTGEIEVLGFLGALNAVRAYREAIATDPDNAIADPDDHFTIVCDSQYVVTTFSEHLDRWIAAKWRKDTRGAIKHQVLWQDVADLRDQVGSHFSVVHQKGHTKRASDVVVDPLVEANDRADRAAGIVSRHIRDTGFVPQPQPVVWLPHVETARTLDEDVRKLRMLAERVLLEHGRAAAVEAFRLATHATGVRE